MSFAVIVVRRPKPGRARELRRLVVDEHYEFLRVRGYVTNKPPFVLESSSGEMIEIFEWKSREAQRNALSDPAVKTLQSRLALLCDLIPISELPEASARVAHFDSAAERAGEHS